MKKRELTFIIVSLILGAIFGGLIGDIIGSYLPPGAPKTVFTTTIPFGFSAVKYEFYTFSITIGLMIKINFMSMLVVLLVIIYFKWWYL